MEPWKTNLEPSKLTCSCTGWLWVVQVVTGDSQEEVPIFRKTPTNTASYQQNGLTQLPLFLKLSLCMVTREKGRRGKITKSNKNNEKPFEVMCCISISFIREKHGTDVENCWSKKLLSTEIWKPFVVYQSVRRICNFSH